MARWLNQQTRLNEKKGKTGKAHSKQMLLVGGEDNERVDDAVATTYLNEKVKESFWHKDFDFRRYAEIIGF